MSPPASVDVDLKSDANGSGPIPGPLTVDGVATVRAKAPQIPLGVAAASSSDMFKSPVRWVVSCLLLGLCIVSGCNANSTIRLRIPSQKQNAGTVSCPGFCVFMYEVFFFLDCIGSLRCVLEEYYFRMLFR